MQTESFNSLTLNHLHIIYAHVLFKLTPVYCETANLLEISVQRDTPVWEFFNKFILQLLSLDTTLGSVIGNQDSTDQQRSLQLNFLPQINPTIPLTPAVYSFEQESCASLVNLNRVLLFVISRFGIIRLWRSHDTPQDGLVGIFAVHLLHMVF